MQNPLFWIEWLDRLDRVLKSARQDIALLTRALNPRVLQGIERSQRQLGALINDLRLLDREVFGTGSKTPADSLQAALERTVVQLKCLVEIPPTSAPGALDRMLAASDAALRDSCYEAAMLLAPQRRRA